MFSPLDRIVVSKKSNPDVHMAMEYAKDFYDREYSSLFLRSGLMIHTLADYQKSIEKLYALFEIIMPEVIIAIELTHPVRIKQNVVKTLKLFLDQSMFMISDTLEVVKLRQDETLDLCYSLVVENEEDALTDFSISFNVDVDVYKRCASSNTFELMRSYPVICLDIPISDINIVVENTSI